MVSHLFFSQLGLVALVWLCLMLHWVWPSDSVAACLTTLEPLWSAILSCGSCSEPTYTSSPITMRPEDHQSSWPTASLGARRQSPCGCG
jgi:hypothetical protein